MGLRKKLGKWFGILAIAAGAAFFVGCESDFGGDGGTVYKSVAFPDVSKPFLGYGLVNNWSILDPQTVLKQLDAANVQAAPFEFFEWASPEKFAQTDELILKFEKWLEESQESKTILYVTLYNANLGLKKYGDAGITADKYASQIKKVADKFGEWVLIYPNLYITPCGEGGSGKSESFDKRMQEYCKAIIPRNRLVNNWGSTPSGMDGMGFYCQHPSKTGAKLGAAAWIMSDHSLLIMELNGGTGLYGTANYETTKAFAVRCLKNGNPFLFYHFDRNGEMDAEALRALKDAWAEYTLGDLNF